MSKYYHDVKKFHDKFGLVTPINFTLIPQDLHEFRVKFFHEEYNEYVEAFETRDLPMAVDSLIDLVYITCGAALLHGFGDELFFDDKFERRPTGTYTTAPLTIPERPALLPLSEHHLLKETLFSGIQDYVTGYQKESEQRISDALRDLYHSSIAGAEQMGFHNKRWNLLWDDVQRANMSKERALKADQSKRGSAWDVIKPAGWQPPATEKLVEQMVKGEL